MYYKMFFRFMLVVVLIAGVSISSGCSHDDDQKKKAEAERVLQEKKREVIRERLREQLRKEQAARFPKENSFDEKVTEKHIADAEYCMQQFQRCTDTCSGRNCEDKCLKFLSGCEKDLPVEVQTLKKY
jgi:hypothetical protein